MVRLHEREKRGRRSKRCGIFEPTRFRRPGIRVSLQKREVVTPFPFGRADTFPYTFSLFFFLARARGRR